MASNEQRTFIYLNFDIDPFTAELVFPQGVPKGGSVSLVFGAFQKGRSVKTTKFTEEFARMVSQKFRVSSPLIDGSPQCFIRISLVKEGAEPPLIPNPNKTVSLLKKPPVPAETSQQPKRAPPEPQFPVTIDSDDEEENVEEVDDNDVLDENAERDVPERAGPAAVKSVAAVSGASRETASKAAAQKFAESNGSVEDHSDSDESIESRPSSPFDDAGDDAAESTASDGDEPCAFRCTQCPAAFHFESELQKHRALEHGILEVCKHCSKKFPSKFSLVRHMWSHLSRSRLPFRCAECKKGFITKRELLGHKAKPHMGKLRAHQENVTRAENRLQTRRAVTSHEGSEELSCPERRSYSAPAEEEIFFCEFCSEVYLTGHFYRQHVSKHHAEKLDMYPVDISPFNGVEKDPKSGPDEGKFRCTHCDKCTGLSFREVCNHISDEHPTAGVYACKRCTLVFSNEEEYGAHSGNHLVRVTPSQSSPGFKDYHCNLCSEVLNHRKTLVRHLQQHHRDPNIKPYACDICPSRFRGKASLYIHTRKHNTQVDRRRFPCTQCPKIFTAKQFLKRHEEAVHARLLPFACTHCSKRFYFERHLQQHLVMSHRSKLTEEQVAGLGLIHNFQCEECGFTSYSERTIRRHVYSHTGTYPFTCEVCNRGFVFRFELTAHHARRHLHQKLHCHLCSRIFFIKERFEKHLSAHQENWGFTCPVCGQLFETQGYLENHQLRHSGKTPYECTDCGKRFSAPQGLTFHKQQHHHAKRPRHVGNSRMDHWPLGCDICGIRFKYLSSQQAHMAFHHPSTEGESLQCTYCQRKLGSKLALSQHLRKHTNEKYKCKHCDRCFQSYVGCRTHQVVMHTRKFKTSCPFCSKGCVSIFDLKRHLKTVHNAVVVKEHNLEMLDADGTEAIEVMDESMIVGEEAIHIVEEDGMEGITEEGDMHIVEEDGIEVVGEGAVQVVGDDGIHFVSHEQAMELISQEGMQVVKGQYIHADLRQDVQLVSDEGAKGGNEVVLLELGEPSVQT
ncbi:zinc finger protein 808 [Rhipicephalus sanguineus]|uniref:zinc finger protein 808 n=1 Tax=Rhipicephalus sanguineus TaxID=34632 RepID=UPI0020C50E52|nr:zinc finger protein 808 [Rhipicephalus sanguineus]